MFVSAVLATDPTNLWALRALASASSKLGWLEITVFALEAVRELRPDDLENALALGTALLATGRHEDALKVADRALKSLPLDARAQDLMRRASIEQAERTGGWSTHAATELSGRADATLQNSPVTPTAQIVTPGDWTQRLIDEALARLAEQPDNLAHYVSLVNGYRRLGRWDQALDWIRKARARKVSGADVALEEHETELRALLLEHRYKEAESMLARSQDDPELQTRCATAREAWLTFRISESRRALECSPTDVIARQTLAGLYLEKGEIDLAIAEYQQNENVPTARIPALVGLGRAFKRKKHFDQAIERFTTAKRELVVMDDVKKDVIYELGGCLLLKGEIDAAMAEFKSIHEGEEFISPEIAAKLAGAFTRTAV
jgi:pentatricopeptide repeat protein